MQENSFLFLIVFLQNMSSLLDMIEDELQSLGELSFPITIVGESSKTKVDDVEEQKLGQRVNKKVQKTYLIRT